jgi:hypothetical protein
VPLLLEEIQKCAADQIARPLFPAQIALNCRRMV